MDDNQSKVLVSEVFGRVVFAFFLWILSDWVAAWLWVHNPPLVNGFSFGRALQIFELQSFTHLLALGGIGYLFLPFWKRDVSLRYPLVAFFLFSLVYLTLFQTFAKPSYDYSAWFHGMQSQLQTGNPYMGVETPMYWYPPALAQMMSIWYRMMDACFPAAVVLKQSHSVTIFQLVFYVFQSVQVILLNGAFWLLYLFCRDIRIPRRDAALITFLFLVFNVPLFRLLIFHQPNLWLVVAILLIILMRDRSPLIAGLALAVGFHIKLYPAILGLPLLLTWRWKPILWAGVFTTAFFLLETSGGSNLEVWQRFLARLSDPPIGSFYRDNSIHGISKNLLKPFHLTDYTVYLQGFLQLLAVIWMGSRMFRREWLFRRLRASGDGEERAAYRFNEQIMDTLVLSLFISPQVFEHHYNLIIVPAIWTLLTRGEAAPIRVMLGIGMIYLIPIYDVVPLSWNRIAGLLVLMSTRPVSFPAAWPAWPPSLFKRWLGPAPAA